MFYRMLYIFFLVLICSNIDSSLTGAKKRKLDQFEEEEDDILGYGSGDRFCNIRSDSGISRKEMDSHIRRFVSLFLRVSGLKDKDVQSVPGHQVVDARVHLTISANHLSLLQKLSRGEISSVAIADLDEIMCKMLYRPRLEEISDFWSRINLFRWLPSLSMPQFFMIAIMLTSLYYYHLYGLKHAIVFILLALTFLDALLKYSQLLRDAQLKRFLASNRHAAADCNPNTRGYFSLIWADLFGDNCYSHETLHSVEVEEVSFVQCLLQTYLITFLELPFLHFGKAVGGFTHVLSERFGAFQYIMFPIILGIVIIPLIGLVMNLMGSSFSASTYFGSFKINSATNSSSSVGHNKENLQIPPAQSAPVINVVINNKSARKRSNISQVTGLSSWDTKQKMLKDKDRKSPPLAFSSTEYQQPLPQIRRVASQPALRMVPEEIEDQIFKANDRKASAPVSSFADLQPPKQTEVYFEKSQELCKKACEGDAIEMDLLQNFRMDESPPPYPPLSGPSLNSGIRSELPAENDEDMPNKVRRDDESLKERDAELASDCSSSDSFEILHEIENMRAELRDVQIDDDSGGENMHKLNSEAVRK